MTNNYVGYIQDISFNDTCDRMVVSTTAKPLIIYKKVKIISDCLIYQPTNQIQKSKSSENIFNLDNIEEQNNQEISDNDSLKGLALMEHNFPKNHEILERNKEFEYRWEKEEDWKIDGPITRIEWANRELGNIFACCCYNKCIYIFQEEKIDNNLKWNITRIKSFCDSVMDISFLPNKFSLQIAWVSLDGNLNISKPSNLLKEWETNKKSKFENGCTCLCCNPSNLDPLTIVVGLKKNIYDKNQEDNPDKKEENNKIDMSGNTISGNDLLQIIYYKQLISGQVILPIKDCGHEDDITDVDWANQNGRTHHMICSTSKDGKFIIWEINLFQEDINSQNFFSYKKILEFNHIKPLWRCSFNDSGTIASCIDEDGETFVFLKVSKNKFIKLDIQKSK